MTESHAVRAFASIGVDIGKDVFRVVGFDLEGKIALRKKVKRLAGTKPRAPHYRMIRRRIWRVN